MFIFKCGVIVLSASYVLSLCSQVTYETRILETGLVLLYIASAAIAGKIMYDRHQHINILGSLTSNPNVTSFANKIASYSAFSMILGFLVHLFLYLFKVDTFSITALNIFVCAFGTLYMWMQGIVTVHVASLFYDKHLTSLRQFLASVSSLVLVVMATFGTVATFLPRGSSNISGAYVCLYITFLCSYILAALFSVFVLTFEKDYKYFNEGMRSDFLLDDACSLNDEAVSETNSIFGTQSLESTSYLIKDIINRMKVS